MANVVTKLALVNLAIHPCKFAKAMLHVILVFTFKQIAVLGLPFALPISLPIHKVPLINASIAPLISPKPMELPFSKISNILIAID